MERGTFDQPTQPSQEHYRVIPKGDLFRRAMIATEIRETIERSREEKHPADPRHRELQQEHGIASRHETHLLRMIGLSGRSDEYGAYLDQQENTEVKEDIWVS